MNSVTAADRQPWLVVIDPQRVFADPDSEWAAADFDQIVAPIQTLAEKYRGRVIVTRWLPARDRAGSWGAYFEAWPFADQPDDHPLFELVDFAAELAAGPPLDERTFGKFGAQLVERTGPQPHLVLTGVATDCCVISTALAAADAGATVSVVADACAGSSESNHRAALQVMGLYSPQITVVGTVAELGSG